MDAMKTNVVVAVVLAIVLQWPMALAAVIEERVCIGTNGRMSVPSNRDQHYRNLRERYTNCTYVDGNLELTWLQDDHLDLNFLQYIREVTGYVLISHVDVRRVVLPKLQIIRGRMLFKLNSHDEQFALIITLSKMYSLEMPALRDIFSGSVGELNNYNLCHIKTIKWNEIITGPNAKLVQAYNFTSPERLCSSCDETCEHGCWGEGAENCQKFSKIYCSPQCYQGRCFGPNPHECCHLFCAGGCTGPKRSDCLACHNFYDDGVCTQECPPLQRYNTITSSLESNPNGKFAYGAMCVKNCPDHLLKDNGACVRSCPMQKKALNRECVNCDGPCPKKCEGEGSVHSGNIDKFRNCTIIEGSISILNSTFTGFQQVFTNYTFGEHYGQMHPDRLEVFSTLKEITGFLHIDGSHKAFTNLSYFRNLEIIRGRQLTDYFSSLYIVKTELKSLGLDSLKNISFGSISILENKNLCFSNGLNWTRIKKSSTHGILLHNNKNKILCGSMKMRVIDPATSTSQSVEFSQTSTLGIDSACTTTGAKSTSDVFLETPKKKGKLDKFETEDTREMTHKELERYVLLRQVTVLKAQEENCKIRQEVLLLVKEKLLREKENSVRFSENIEVPTYTNL